MKYPGDSASPEAVAQYFAHVAEGYKLPRILPVMTSCVELTAAWVGPGDVKEVPGYLSAVDYNSLGYFQQRPGEEFGWGTPEQLIDAEYAVHRFCQEAVKFFDDEWHKDTVDPEVLGRWCQAVQRSAYPDAYKDKGYPMAVKLLATEDQWPQREAAFTKDGWLYDVQTKEFIKLPPKSMVVTDGDGWGYQRELEGEEQIVKPWAWPEAWDEPWTSGRYDQMFPTRYNWRADVEEWARYLVDYYDVWVTTYWAHPPYWWRETTSFDVWGLDGRGYDLDPVVGDKIFDLLFNYGPEPDIDWIIYKGRMWTAGGGWESAPDGAADSDPGHWKHIHVTYK